MIKFFVVRQLRARRWYAALFLFGVALVVGSVVDHSNRGVFTPTALTALVIAFEIGVGGDRHSGYSAFQLNFIDANREIIARLVATALLTSSLLIVAFISAAALWHSVGLAVYSVVLLVLLIILLAPLAFVFDVWVGIAAPLAPAALLAFGIFAYAVGQDPVRALHRVGLDRVALGHVSTLWPFAQFCLVASAAMGITAAVVWTFTRPRFRITSAHEHQRP